MKIFLDANILFSAALPNSRMAAFLEILFETATLLSNDYAIEEARRNLTLKAPKRLAAFNQLVERCEQTKAIATIDNVTLAQKDIPILGGAVAGSATHLLTGDERDFGKLWGKTIRGVKVISPRMLAEELGLL
jgi:predicted nucleic acid-binding protein